MSDASNRITALILAGSRGPADPVAAQAGVSHKALAPVAGVPMLLRVVRTLRQSPVIGDIALCLEPEALATADAAVAAELRNSAIRWLPVGRSPAETVGLALRELREALPVLVTTADHPLLTPVMVEHFCRAAPATADVAIGLATDAVIRTQHPQSVRTYYRFGGIGYSGCNLFLLRTGAAERAAAFWQAMERHRKRPWRLALAIGPLTLCRFWMGRLSLEAALGRLSRLAGARIVALELPFAEAAIDVDKPVDLALAEAILARRPPLA